MAWKNVNTNVVLSNSDFDKYIASDKKDNYKSGHWEPTHEAILDANGVIFDKIVPPPPSVMDPNKII